MPASSARQSIDTYFKALGERDVEAIVRLMDPKIVIEWPQSGERFRGRDTFKSVFTNYPGLPTGELKNVTGSEDRWVLTPSWTPLQVVGSGDDYTIEGYITYPNGERWSWVAIVHFRDGLVATLTEYFAAPFPPADWRSKWAEKMEPRTQRM